MKLLSIKRKTILSTAALTVCAAGFVLFMSHDMFAQYTGAGNHAVTITDAQRYIRNFRTNPIAPTTHGVYFERDIYEKILAQPGCVGIRQYFAQTDGKVATLVLVGVDAKGNDLVKGTIGEAGAACPPLCAEIKLYE